MMKIIEVHCPFWPFNTKYDGVTLYPFIFYKKGHYSETLRRHEWIHIRQIKQDGWLKYHKKWNKEYYKYGYYEISYEREAYTQQEYTAYNPWEENPPIIIGSPKPLKR